MMAMDYYYLPTNLIRNVDHADVDVEHFGDDSDVALRIFSAPVARSFFGFVAIATAILVFDGGRVLTATTAPLVDESVFGATKHRGQFLGPEHDVADRPV